MIDDPSYGPQTRKIGQNIYDFNRILDFFEFSIKITKLIKWGMQEVSGGMWLQFAIGHLSLVYTSDNADYLRRVNLGASRLLQATEGRRCRCFSDTIDR